MVGVYVLFILLLRAYGAVLYAKLGENVTLPCRDASRANYLSWYRQVAGDQPRIIFSLYKSSPEAIKYYLEFTDKSRFSLHAGEGFYHLNISDVQHSDSAMYFCGQTLVSETEFSNGTFLAIKESSSMSFLQQTESYSALTGGSVTLDCTVLPGANDSQRSVYWFKRDPGETRLGILYVHSHSGGQCVETSGPAAQKCTYSLTKRNLKQLDSGVYYCAVASCGEIVFGRGSRLDVEGNQQEASLVVLHGVGVALLVSSILNILLFAVICHIYGRKTLQSNESQPRESALEHTADILSEASTVVQYVAVDFKKKPGTSRRQRDTEEETVYSGVRLTDRQ